MAEQLPKVSSEELLKAVQEGVREAMDQCYGVDILGAIGDGVATVFRDAMLEVHRGRGEPNPWHRLYADLLRAIKEGVKEAHLEMLKANRGAAP